MKRFAFSYALTLDFSQPVSKHTFLLRFAPESDAAQQVWGLDCSCRPEALLPLTRDAFGNRLAVGHLEAPASSLAFDVRGDCLLRGEPVAADCPVFCAMQTERTAPDDTLRALAQGLPRSAEDAALQAAERIRARVVYRKGVTDERTTAAQALERGAGVCQDMAHLLLCVLREAKIPARYVVGLIPGEGETHAWVEVYDGKRFIGVDPTHLKRTDDTYLRVSTGRDSRDCAINRGVFCGATQQTMTVLARMIEI